MISAAHPPTAQLPLHEWASLRSELVWIYDRPVRPEHRQTHGGPPLGYRAWFLRRGSVAIAAGRRTVHAAAGSWIMLPQVQAAQDFSRNAHLLSVHFVSQWPSGENLLVLREPIVIPGKHAPALARDATQLERILRRQFPHNPAREQIPYDRASADYASFLRLQGLFFHWLAGWFQLCLNHGARLTRLSSGDTRPFQAARCLNQAPLDRAFPADWLQRETGLGLMRLNQLFFREFGLTTRKYWDRRRLDFARQCLETSLMPMKEISYRLNFRSDSHFVIWFRRLAGSRPGEYRRRYLGNLHPAATSPTSERG
jgi:AraC-like DNA-binding protein